YDKTTPYFKLPEAERQKYQNIPPTPVEQAEQEKKEQADQGGIPGWVWAVAGLMSMFFFAIAVLLVVYFFVLRPTSFEVTVVNAPPGSDIQVDGSSWGVSDEDGARKLLNLKSGRRTITVNHPNYTCLPREVTGGNGVIPEPVRVQCKEKPVQPGEDCSNIGVGEEDKAERCFNSALAGLGDPFNVDDLVRALNILIVNFKSGSYEIPAVRLAAIQKAASYIKRVPPQVVLEVGGHTDTDGSDASNQTLSENRAKAVKDKLVQFGARPETLQTRGYGETRPKADNTTDLGKFHNRRIEYSVVRK
ncbi:MAG: OmpA family protein, partial [Acidobacteriota bacterium]